MMAPGVPAGASKPDQLPDSNGGMPVSATILGSGGAPLGNSTSAGPMSQRAYVANLPVGVFYVQAYAAANAKNNYKITIKTSP